MSIALVAFLLFLYGGLVITIVVNLIFLDKATKLLHQIRKLASLYPPFPIVKDEDGADVDRTKVEIRSDWNDEEDGRS